MNNSTLCIGADIHLQDIVLRGVDKASGHEVIEPFRVTNNLPGAQSAAATIAQTATSLGYTHVEIAWKAMGMLWLPFHRFLATTPLQPFEPQLICVNPKLVAKFKAGLDLRGRKDDEHDAHDVAARLRFGELPLFYVPDDLWQGLRRLTRHRYELSRSLSREKMRFQSIAFRKCSDWKRVKPLRPGACGVQLSRTPEVQ